MICKEEIYKISLYFNGLYYKSLLNKDLQKKYFFYILYFMAKKNSTSFDLTEVTAPVLEKLKLANWDIKEVVNAGILMFSQAKLKEQQFFAFMATKGLILEENKVARDMVRNWILEIVADAQVYNEEMKRLPASKKKVSG